MVARIRPPSPRRLVEGALVAAALCALGACQGNRAIMDPALLVRTSGGFEQGVSTDYGVVFLGRTARTGDVEVMAFYGDGPSIEGSVIEPLGGGLYTVETEIRLPEVTLVFDDPEAGLEVEIRGRWSREKWDRETTVERHPSVDGILLALPDDLDEIPSIVGAGVFVLGPEQRQYPLLGGPNPNRRLLGLVSGRVRLIAADGVQREYLTVIGPESLWRLVTYRRKVTHKQRWVYREDIL